jgi:hypothetical protein
MYQNSTQVDIEWVEWDTLEPHGIFNPVENCGGFGDSNFMHLSLEKTKFVSLSCLFSAKGCAN